MDVGAGRLPRTVSKDIGIICGLFHAHDLEKTVLCPRRLEFVKLALKNQQNLSQLCRRSRMSRKSGYKWVKRFEPAGAATALRRWAKVYNAIRPHEGPGLSLFWNSLRGEMCESDAGGIRPARYVRAS
jgi:hypothetical protein